MSEVILTPPFQADRTRLMLPRSWINALTPVHAGSTALALSVAGADTAQWLGTICTTDIPTRALQETATLMVFFPRF